VGGRGGREGGRGGREGRAGREGGREGGQGGREEGQGGREREREREKESPEGTANIIQMEGVRDKGERDSERDSNSGGKGKGWTDGLRGRETTRQRMRLIDTK
jgi:hypothetical protein